jgi:SAM-dependent methyltransferase
MSTARRRIAENRAAHDRLDGAYDARHPEIFNDVEQARLVASVARAVAAIASATPAESRVMLDIGAGTGNLTDKLLAHPGKVYASDVSPRMVQALAARHQASGRVSPVILNGTDLRPERDHSVDLVGAYSVLHHVPDYLALVAEMVRVVRPGGVILLEHEKAPQYWAPSAELTAFLHGAVVWPEKHWSRFADPRRYWARLRPLLSWRRWTNPRWMPEGDLHIWPDDHVEWEAVEARLRALGCEIVLVEDHLSYEPRFDRDAWERARHRVADTRVLLARKRA